MLEPMDPSQAQRMTGGKMGWTKTGRVTFIHSLTHQTFTDHPWTSSEFALGPSILQDGFAGWWWRQDQELVVTGRHRWGGHPGILRKGGAHIRYPRAWDRAG